MFCKTCQYPLWNLKDRTCPECGSGFAPSRFAFIPNSVQFCCPHCRQAYYGTSSQGHLVPPVFDCVTCANRIEMDEMVLLPAAGIDEKRTRARVNPWLERGEGGGGGRAKRWLRTVLYSMVTPGSLILATPRESAKRRTLAFAVCTVVTATAMSVVMPFFILIPLIAPLGGNLNTFVESVLGFVGGLVLWGLLTCAVVPVYAGVAHLLLSGGKPRGGYRETFHATAMASGASVLGGVPIFGMFTWFLGLMWWGVSLSVMLRSVHRVSKVRAFVAGLLPPISVLVVVVGGFVGLMLFGFTMATQATGAMSAAVRAQQIGTLRAVREDAADHGERHIGSMMLDGRLKPTDAIASGMSSTSKIVAGGVELSGFVLTATDEEKRALAATLDAMLTEDVIAYRVGDLVVIRDVPEPPPDPALWRLVYSLEPTMNAGLYSAAGPRSTTGAVQYSLPSAMELMPDVASQNAVRARNGLRPLPALETIVDGAPFRVTESGPEGAGSENGADGEGSGDETGGGAGGG